MSSNKGPLYRISLLCALLFLPAYTAPAQQHTAPGGLSCPALIEVTESAKPTPGWSAVPVTKSRAFERVSIYNGEPGGKEYDLAPDDEKQEGSKVTQTWNLKGYRTMNLFLRCRYHDTQAVLQMDIPAKLETCTLKFTLDKKGSIVGQSEARCR